VTDGSPNLHFWDRKNLTQTRVIPVNRMNGKPATQLNEIEWYRGRILANVWFEDVLLVIDPASGTVEKEYGTCHQYFLNPSATC
jgi:glutamine cyclotransferase